MHDQIRDLKLRAAADFSAEGIDSAGRGLFYRGGQVDQVRVMGADRQVAPSLPGRIEIGNLCRGQRGGIPLPLVSGKDLQGITVHLADPCKGLGQAAGYGHMGAEQGHLTRKRLQSTASTLKGHKSFVIEQGVYSPQGGLKRVP
jgi:hypothetical protein